MAQLTVGVHTVDYVCGGEAVQRAEQLCGGGEGVHVGGRQDLGVRVKGRDGSPGTTALSLQRRGAKRGDAAGCGAGLAGATEARWS